MSNFEKTCSDKTRPTCIFEKLLFMHKLSTNSHNFCQKCRCGSVRLKIATQTVISNLYVTILTRRANFRHKRLRKLVHTCKQINWAHLEQTFCQYNATGGILQIFVQMLAITVSNKIHLQTMKRREWGWRLFALEPWRLHNTRRGSRIWLKRSWGQEVKVNIAVQTRRMGVGQFLRRTNSRCAFCAENFWLWKTDKSGAHLSVCPLGVDIHTSLQLGPA